MYRYLLLFFLLVAPAAARDVWTDPHPGIRLLHRTTAGPHRMFAAVIDLTRPGIRVRATRTEDRQAATSRFARDYEVHVAINGDFYSGDRTPVGLAVGDGAQWPGTRDTGTEGFIAVGRDNRALISAPAAVVDPPEDWMDAVVSGRPLVVQNGAAVDPPGCAPHFCERHPRTAVGLDAAGETLYFLVVDGRTNGAIGMTTREVGEVLAGLGAHTGLNLDGGGSSAMYVAGAGGVVNTPSDGAERAVANHLGVRIGAPFGDLIGFVRAGDVLDAEANLVGARVALSDGQSTQTGADGLYRFAQVAAGPVDITATMPGFAPGMRNVAIAAGERTWGSVGLAPLPPDMALPPPPVVDAGPVDAGSVDAAPEDAGLVDATLLDAAPLDPLDAAPLDATRDVLGDRGTEPPMADAKPQADQDDTAADVSQSGGCSQAPNPAPWPLALLGLAFWRRRRTAQSGGQIGRQGGG